MGRATSLISHPHPRPAIFPLLARSTSTPLAVLPPPAREVKVTGHDDDDIEKFESEFPELDMPQVRPAGLLQRGHNAHH